MGRLLGSNPVETRLDVAGRRDFRCDCRRCAAAASAGPAAVRNGPRRGLDGGQATGGTSRPGPSSASGPQHESATSSLWSASTPRRGLIASYRSRPWGYPPRAGFGSSPAL